MTKSLRSLFFVTLFLVSCRSHFEITKKETNQYKFTDTTFATVDSTIAKELDPYRAELNKTMSEVLAVSTTKMERGLPESRLGNFLADACMSATEAKGMKADFAMFNNGGLRRGLPEGQITRGDIFELMPFENELVILTISGRDVKKISNFIASKGGEPVSGIRLNIKDSLATDVFIDDIAYDSTKTYRVLTSDYLANGGDSYTFFLDAVRESVSLKVRDAIIFYLQEESKKNKKITVELDGRITNGR